MSGLAILIITYYDILKSDKGFRKMPGKNENIHLFVIQNEYGRLKKEQKSTMCQTQTTNSLTTYAPVPSLVPNEITKEESEQDFPNALEELRKQEIAVINEYNELKRVKQELELKIAQEIESRKDAIAKLKTEILKARESCQTLAKAL
jgi:hypothetical protein